MINFSLDRPTVLVLFSIFNEKGQLVITRNTKDNLKFEHKSTTDLTV